MRQRSIAVCAAMLALEAAVGCVDDAQSSQEGDAGPLATCGDNCSLAQVAAACSDTCGKAAEAGCSAGSDCAKDCSDMASTGPCAPLAYAFLRCLETTQLTCLDSGTAQTGPCDSQREAFGACTSDSAAAAPTSNPFGGACGGVPSDVCPDIPRPGPATVCNAAGDPGPNGPMTSTASCQDRAGNVWNADCTGSSCTCTYNGGNACTCTSPASVGPCSTSCCPGTF
jgi:hypothetical protein